MTKNWTFGQKVGFGFAAVLMLTLAMGLTAAYALRDVVASKDRVITVNAQLLLDAEKMRTVVAQRSAALRAFLLVRDERFLKEMLAARDAFAEILARLEHLAYSSQGRSLLAAIVRANGEHQIAVEAVVAIRRSEVAVENVAQAFEDKVVPTREALDGQVTAFSTWQEEQLQEARQRASDAAASAMALLVIMALAAILLATAVALVLTRTLSRQVGTAVGQVQSSAAELQAAANQQAAGAREQATAMREIATTITELLATSKQIAESAQRVAHIADETVRSASTGEGTVSRAHDSIIGIRRQVDGIVGHMLDLGKKSQQIGAVLDIVSELAEQTNILAINATIEAAGAGEAGRRFAVVADEIRKLADRVADSTKQIRGLIDDVRGAVNTTVMATEGGSKAVDAGSHQFVDVTAAFKQIAGLVATTTEAAREIELSTKQQATAVEQVNLAISNVAQTTRETETSSSQTLQTASQLAGLSKGLQRLIQPQDAS